MIELQMTVDSKEFHKQMRTLDRQNANIKPLFKRFQAIMIRSFNENFRQRGRPQKWMPLSAWTIAGRRKHSDAPLQDTGQLRASCTVEGAKGNITRFRQNSLVMGTNLKQAKWLQEGTKPYTITPRHARALRIPHPHGGFIFRKAAHHPGLPARPFIMIQKEDEEHMIKEAKAFALKEK